MIRFAQLNLIYLLWLVPILVLFYIWSFKKHRKILRRFADKTLLNELTLSLDMRRRRLKTALIIIAVFFGLFSLMRPQWGFHWEKIKRKGIDILIAIDTSKSMLADDVKPNRLERSKLAVKDMVKKLKGDRIGLIAFSGDAFLQCPLTVDYSGFMLSLDSLSTDTIQKGGTSISSAIMEAVKVYKKEKKKYKILVLITDGEDHHGDFVKMAEDAKKEGVKIFCIGIGTKEGELIPITNKDGGKGFLKDNAGNAVKTRLDESTLQKIALDTGGCYVRSSGANFGLDLIYEKKLSKIKKKEFKEKMVRRFEERFQIPLAICLLLLLLEPFISERKKNAKISLRTK